MADDFKAQDFREAVRDILKDYRKEYLALGNALVERILEKLKDGVPVIKAVEDAVKEAGFLGANAKAVSNVLFLAACAGYGVLSKFVTAASEEAIKRKLMSVPWTGDKMKLSERLHSLKVRQNVIFAISSAMKQAKTVAQMAMDIYDGYNSGQGVLDQAVLRKDLNKVLQMARRAVQGDETILGELRKKALKIQQYTRSMKTKPLQAAYHAFLDACTADVLNETAIERAAWTAIEETTRYQAERMARTEAARAWFDGYIAAREDDSDVWGYRWRLSSRHYRCPFDQCDVCANMNVGYGKGIYPKNKVPSIPRHPHCMCMLEEVFSWEQDGEEIKPEGAREYIDSLDERKKQALFGEDGLQAYEAGGDWQKILRGWDGFRKPKSRLSLDDFPLKNGVQGGIIRAGALSGALTDKNDPDWSRRIEHANRYYDFMRNANAEILLQKIAKASGLSVIAVQKVYNHVLFAKYQLEQGYKTFDPSYDMAESFQRLIEGVNVQPHDYLMLKHERLEWQLMNRYGHSYEKAHVLANKKYNYQEALYTWQKERGDL